ncbi:MAG: glycosyltransferase [Acidobacteriia bacterium]|nr:glycosyltransferase [Terriglobia bacterium]
MELWASGDNLRPSPGIKVLKHKRLGLILLLIKSGIRARLIDSFYFLIEYPNILMASLWVLMKILLRFEWIKVIHDGSLPSRYTRFNAFQKLAFKFAIGSVDEFVGVSREIAEFLFQMGVRQNILTVNALLPTPPSELTCALPKEMESALVRHRKRVISTGVFIPTYGFDHAAQAVENLRRETGEDIGLILIDGVFARDENYRAATLQGRDWIAVFENVPHPQVLEIFRRSDVFVRGFRHEGYGLSRIEAIWQGIPVIAAQGEESRGMWLYEFGDLEKLTTYLRKALFVPDTREIAHWSQVFQREAEENLARWKNILKARQL